MHCLKCGSSMELLPPPYFHAGKNWYGCKKCNTVIEYNFDSFTGRFLGTNPCNLSYQEFMEQVAKKGRKV